MKKTTYTNFEFTTTPLSTVQYANVSYMDKFFSKYGSCDLKSRNLKDVLDGQTNEKDIVLSDPSDSEKCQAEKKSYFGNYGAIFAVDSSSAINYSPKYEKTVVERGSGQLVFIDIDGVDKAEAKYVFDNADQLKKKVPSLVAINYSVSKNLHMFSFGHWTNPDNYCAKQQWVSDLIIDEVNKTFGFNWPKDVKTNDDHQSQVSHRFPTCYTSGYKWWDEACNIHCDEVDVEVEEPDVKFTEPFKGTFTTTANHKLKIDKTFKVGNYCGNDLRWRTANVVLWYCKGDRDDAKDWIEKHFSNYSEFNFGPDSYSINPLVKKWFDDEFGVLASTETATYKAATSLDGVVIDPDKTLSDYRQIVEDSIDNNNSTLLVADTGLGKTTLFNKIAADRKCIILVPFNCQLDLYNGFNVVKSGNDYYIDEFRSNVAVWDQFVKRTNDYILNTKFKDFTIVIDECHQLWGDRDYRDSAVKTVELLNNFEGKKLFMTATPTMEESLFDIDEKLKFRRERKHINLKWIDSTDPITLMKKLVKKSKKHYDHVLVFSDMYSKRLWLDDGCESTLIHSAFLDDPLNVNAKDVLDTTKELLIDKVTYATKFAYSGKNFKNKGKILVIVNSNYDTDAQYIIQALGRLRMADKLDAILVNTITEHDYGTGLRMEKVQNDLLKHPDEIAELMIHRDDDGIPTKKNIEIITELNNYYNICSGKDYIIEELTKTGYIDVTEVKLEIDDKTGGGNELKRDMSNWLTTYIYENRKLPNTNENTNCYVRDWIKELYRIYKSVGNMKLIADYISERGMMDCVSMDTMIADLRTMLKCAKLSEETRKALAVDDEKEYRKWVNSMIEKFDDTITKNKYRDMCKKLRNILQRVDIVNKNVPVDELLMDAFKLETCDAFEQRIEYVMNKNNSKKEKITLKWIGGETLPDIEGILENHGVLEFESKGAAIMAIGVPKATFFRFLRGDNTKMSKYWEIV